MQSSCHSAELLLILGLSYQIGRRRRAHQEKNPDAKIISLGIGDTTEPVPKSIADAMQKAAAGLATLEGYSGCVQLKITDAFAYASNFFSCQREEGRGQCGQHACLCVHSTDAQHLLAAGMELSRGEGRFGRPSATGFTPTWAARQMRSLCQMAPSVTLAGYR
jgi:hypothetical protein